MCAHIGLKARWVVASSMAKRPLECLHKRNGGHAAVFKPRFGGFPDVLNVANLAHTYPKDTATILCMLLFYAIKEDTKY